MAIEMEMNLIAFCLESLLVHGPSVIFTCPPFHCPPVLPFFLSFPLLQFHPVYYSLDHFGFSPILSKLLLTPFTFTFYGLIHQTWPLMVNFLFFHYISHLLLPSDCHYHILELAIRPQLIDHLLHGLGPATCSKNRAVSYWPL